MRCLICFQASTAPPVEALWKQEGAQSCELAAQFFLAPEASWCVPIAAANRRQFSMRLLVSAPEKPRLKSSLAMKRCSASGSIGPNRAVDLKILSAVTGQHGKFEMCRMNHQEAYSSEDGCSTNMAEGFFSRLRRAEIGHHHHIAGPYLLRYAQSVHGARTTAVYPTAIRCSGSPRWRLTKSPQSISAGIGAACCCHFSPTQFWLRCQSRMRWPCYSQDISAHFCL